MTSYDWAIIRSFHVIAFRLRLIGAECQESLSDELRQSSGVRRHFEGCKVEVANPGTIRKLCRVESSIMVAKGLAYEESLCVRTTAYLDIVDPHPDSHLGQLDRRSRPR